MIRVLATACFCTLLAASTYADSISFTTLPANGEVAGGPGAVVGWGFSVTNTTTNWLVLNDSFFTGSTVNGTYIDYLVLPGAPQYVAGPTPESTTVTQVWDPGATPQLGLGEFDINSTASPGPIPGQIGVDYTLFSQDPNDPNFDPGSFVSSGQLFASVQADVVPEPASIVTLTTGFAPLALFLWNRRRTHRAR